MQIKIKVDDKATVVLNVKEEMSISEFMGVVSLVSKIDKYAYNQKTVVDDIMTSSPPNKKAKKTRKKQKRYMSDGEKKDFVKRWYSSTRPERKEWAVRQGTTYSKLASLVYFHKRSLENEGYNLKGEMDGR